MDFTRNTHPQAQPVRDAQPMMGTVGTDDTGKKSHHRRTIPSWYKAVQMVVLVCGTLVVAALLLLVYNQQAPNEAKYLDTSKFQAVFLNGGVTNGQVLYSTYFGHIVALNNAFLVLQDVYYITSSNTSSTTSTASNSNVQLTKLGCQQLHAPYDQMVINRSQVAFWENLQASGQVVEAINNYQKENPNGPNCSQATSSTPASTTSTTPSTTNP
jgi:hypothetical protein